MKYISYPIQFMIGALGAPYIVTDLLFEYAVEAVELRVKAALGR